MSSFFDKKTENYINLNSEQFSNLISDILSKYIIDQIIETGTFNGLGSTKILAKTGLPLVTIESCFEHYSLAKENLKDYNNITFIHGSSLNVEECLKFISEDDIYNSDLVLAKKISVDGNAFTDARHFYKNEVKGFSENPLKSQNVLLDLIDNYTKQLVFLDSAGGVGYLEFQKFINLNPDKLKTKILVLDDISHVKHYRSVVYLKTHSYPVHILPGNRVAYCIFDENIL